MTGVVLLLPTQVPDDLRLAEPDPHRYFSSNFLERASDYERFLRIDFLLSTIVLLVVLAIYALKGARFTRESAAGRIGTGMLLGMLGFAIVWLTQVPFGVAALWWERKHHISKQGYLDYLAGSWAGLAGQFLFICLAILIVMAIARFLPRTWWIPGGAVFVALGFAFAFVQPYLLPDLKGLKSPELKADAATFARRQGLEETPPVKVEKVRKYTTAPNAEAVGIGPSRRVILWDTLLDGRFKQREVSVILAHEIAHLSREHILKGVGWFALLILPTGLLIAVVTRRRGGMYRPEAVPLALFVLIAVQVATVPLQNVLTRRVEREADWISFETARDPRAARATFHDLAANSLSQPRPPTWAYVLFDTHPTIMQRIAMVDAWERRQDGRPSR